ncbi:MAG TPA: alpha/beta hydrolase [Variovorax sp.]|nr:alpha/beta hydrolase [Variovorax sp.]
MPTLDRSGLTVDYLADGAGPSVVLIHSSVSGNRQWKRLVEALRPAYRCFAPNLRGYGSTSPWPGQRKQTLDDAADVALALCDTVPGPIRLIGHSWGASVALAVASKLGTAVSHLALYEPAMAGLLAGHGRAEASAESMRIYAAVQELGDAGRWMELAEVFTDYFNGVGAWATTPPERKQIIASQIPPNRHEWDAGSHPRTAQSFEGVTARTLILRGSQTPLALKETVDVLCEAFPHWTMREFDGAGHMGPLTHSAIINAELQSFLALR